MNDEHLTRRELDRRLYNDVQEIKRDVKELSNTTYTTREALAVLKGQLAIIGASAGLVGSALWALFKQLFF